MRQPVQRQEGNGGCVNGTIVDDYSRLAVATRPAFVVDRPKALERWL